MFCSDYCSISFRSFYFRSCYHFVPIIVPFMFPFMFSVSVQIIVGSLSGATSNHEALLDDVVWRPRGGAHRQQCW